MEVCLMVHSWRAVAASCCAVGCLLITPGVRAKEPSVLALSLPEALVRANSASPDVVRAHYAERDKRLLRYRAVPWIYHRMPAQDNAYALFHMGATLYRRDLSTTIDLAARGSVSERRRRGIRDRDIHMIAGSR